MTLTPGEIRAVTFDQARRGYDPSEVDALIASLADHIERLSREIEEARAERDKAMASEQAMRLSSEAMAREREGMLEAARAEERRLLDQAAREAERTVSRADGEAAEIVMDARRQALEVIAGARRDADYLLAAAHETAAPLMGKIEQLRAVVRRTENLMRGLASGALGELSQAHLMLDEAPDGDGPGVQIVFTDQAEVVEPAFEDDTNVSPLPAAVDRLLSHLREIG